MALADENVFCSAVSTQNSPAIHGFQRIFAADALQSAEGVGIRQRSLVIDRSVCYGELLIATKLLPSQFHSFNLSIHRRQSTGWGGLSQLTARLFFQPLLEAFIHDSLGI